MMGYIDIAETLAVWMTDAYWWSYSVISVIGDGEIAGEKRKVGD